MTSGGSTVRRRGLPWRTISILIVCVGLVVLIGANAHLVYVALKSQPDCVPHAKQAGDPQLYSAARSAC